MRLSSRRSVFGGAEHVTNFRGFGRRAVSAVSAIFLALFAVVAAVRHMLADDARHGETISQASALLEQHCADCHSAGSTEGGFDIRLLQEPNSLHSEFAKWVRVVDRVHAGEMPPADASQLTHEERIEFVNGVSRELNDQQSRTFANEGRVQGRRLTNLQLERTLQDLLGIDIPLAELMSEEQRTAGFATVAEGQSMSHFQLEQHLTVVDAALEEAFRRATSPADETTTGFTAEEIARTDPSRRCREPEMIGEDAVVWASRLIFYGRLPATTAAEDGWYRFTVRVSARKKPDEHGVWCTVRGGPCISSAPLLSWVTAFEAVDEPRELTFDAWLPKGHMLEIRPGDSTLKMAKFQGGQVGVGEGEPQNSPGLNLHGLTMQRIHRGPDDDTIRRMLFDDLQIDLAHDGEAAEAKRSKQRSKRDRHTAAAVLKSKNPPTDLLRLIHRFAEQAFRSPISAADTRPYREIAVGLWRDGVPLIEALRAGYRAVLCSPRFMYFQESPGVLDEYALASRLSYMLWNSVPDAELLSLANEQQLSSREVLRQQVDRMLKSERGEAFVRDLAAEWLDLRLIDLTEPDQKLYPKFDVIVQHAMLEETHRFLQDMLDRNANVTELIDADFTYLNSRLARYYDIEGVEGDAFQRINLQPEHRRGGLLTQGAILKVTANGTTTSPVIRGVWVGERLLGEHIPAPPQGVPAIEPDIRGAKSIRDLLERHRSDEACAACHVKIDPPGFALENYDPAGRYRRYYPSIDKKQKNKLQIDASYVMADGQPFSNLEEFRRLVCARPEILARNVAEKLLTLGTGGLPTFSDRETLDKIVDESRSDGFALRSILYAVVCSRVFQTK